MTMWPEFPEKKIFSKVKSDEREDLRSTNGEICTKMISEPETEYEE